MNPHVPSLVTFFETQMALNAKAPQERHDLVKIAVALTLKAAYHAVVSNPHLDVNGDVWAARVYKVDTDALVELAISEWEESLDA